MNNHEAERIAAAVHELRPDWPARSILTLIGSRLADKPRRDVAVALAWVACDSATQTPGRVLEAGPWWQAASVDKPAAGWTPYVRAQTCGICGLPRHACELRWAHDHDFESIAHRQPADDAARRVAELRALLAARADTDDAAPEPAEEETSA